ncbi:MAG: class I SAM-dependent methyltransferase, partial [Pseudomonadota bacterium]|nr:class I SAM-dependent methyltransferase [Pseudomonadota bacterium]
MRLRPVDGLDVLHLQCHFGVDGLILDQQGARVTGLNFAPWPVATARALAGELGLDARFVEGNLYDAPTLIADRFDLVFVSWGALIWLPDIVKWARVVAHFVGPSGRFNLAEGHPAVA